MNSVDPVDRMSPEEVDALVASWRDPDRPQSKHLALAVAVAVHRQGRNLPPLPEAAPVPGCDCPSCTGVPADAPVRVAPSERRYRRAADRPPLNVEAARAVPVVEIAERLGLMPKPAGREYVARCPFHDD